MLYHCGSVSIKAGTPGAGADEIVHVTERRIVMTSHWRCFGIIGIVLLVVPQPARPQTPQDSRKAIDYTAEQYVKLILKVGQYKADYIDSYYGPSEWQPAAVKDSLGPFPYQEFSSEVTKLLDSMTIIGRGDLTQSQRKRWRSLDDCLQSLQAMIDILNGKKMTFDEESMAIYRVKAPSYDSLHYESQLRTLDSLIPGRGDLQARFVAFSRQFLVPHDKVDTLMKVTIAQCRALTAEHITLPTGEQFLLDLVPRQPWGAYNWYKGNLTSLIQVDTSRDLFIEDLIGTSAHEGYPGHHVQNVIDDRCLYRDSGWGEYCVQPLFSPRMFGEGEANYGVDLVFPKQAWLEYMGTTICPLAGIDTSNLERYYDILKSRETMKYSFIDAARSYIDGRKSRDAVISWNMHFGVRTRRQAEDEVSFYDKYRSYIITYSVGEDLIRNFILAGGGTESNPAKRWELFKALLTSPLSASDLEEM